MSDVNWRRKLKEMLWSIEHQATYSLTKIGRSQSLNEQFQRLFFRLSNERLAETYSRVQMRLNNVNRGENSRKQASSSPFGNSLEDDLDQSLNQNTNNVNISNLVKQEVIEAIEVDDSNELSEIQLRRIKTECGNGNNNKIESYESMNDGNCDEFHVKNELDDDWVEPKQEVVQEDIPIRTFNPNDISSNGGYSTNANAAIRNSVGSTLRRKDGKEKPSCSKDSKQFSCELCEYGTDRKYHFNRHMQTHTNEKPFRCSRCYQFFTDSSNLKKHMAMHKGEFSFYCSKCLRGFFQSDEKEAHEKNCTYRRYECFICKYFTTLKANLVRHMWTHSGYKPYRCNRCSKGFTRLWSLKYHMTTHTDKRQPFHCKGCFRKFAKVIEKEAHEKDCRYRRYECDICKKYVTAQKTNMEIHMRVHTGEKPFRCEVCMKCFNRKGNLKQHLNNVHNRRNM